MAVTITRTAWIDDDGTGTSGTVINNAEKTTIYNQIDAALAQLAQLTGGNTFTGNQTIAGLLSVTGLGTHQFAVNGAGSQILRLRNQALGVATQLAVGNDADPDLLSLFALASNYSPGSDVGPNVALVRGGSGGLNLSTAGALRVFTNSLQRLQVLTGGQLLINATTMPYGAQVVLNFDAGVSSGLVMQNLYTGNAGAFIEFHNSAGPLAGSITQTGATSVAYGTSSDRRLKTDEGRATDVTALRAVVVHDFTWKADGHRARGVFAQDAHAVFPQAVTVGTDETTESGDLTHPWMTDYSKFVPDLIVGWQQHDAELAALRAAFATLKGSTDAQ